MATPGTRTLASARHPSPAQRGRGWGRGPLALLLALLLLLLTAATTAAQAPPATIRTEIDRDTVTVGDRIHVTATLELPADATADLQGLEQQFGDLEILLVGLPVERVLADGRKEVRVGYDVAAFQVGQTQLPPLTATVRLASGEVVAAAAPALPVTVQSVIPAGENPTDVRDLKPQVSLPVSGGIARRTILLAVAAVALTIAAALLIVRWLRRPKAVIVPLPVAPPSPESVARAELDRIASLGLLERGDVAQLHALLAACIRRYLSDRHHFHAYAMTTTELRREMEEYGVGRWQARLVTGLLTESDAVNFARYRPAYTRCEANLEMAYQIIEAGEPQPEPQAAPAPATSG